MGARGAPPPTAAPALDAQLRLYREIFLASSDGIALIDPEGRYLEQNGAHRDLIGYADAELAGQTPAVHLGDEAFARIGQALGEQGRWRGEVTSRRKDGTPLVLDLSAFTVHDAQGRVLAHVGIKRDVTGRRAREEELRRANERLQELDRLKTQFLNMVGHQLRTPLTPIGMQLDLLRTRGPLNPRQERALAIAERNLLRLNVLVAEMLDVVRLQAGRVTLQEGPLDLGDVAAAAAEDFEEAAARAGVRLEARRAGPVPARGDALRLAQVMHHLLSNAIRSTPRGGVVQVEAAVQGREAVVRVRDTGLGLTGEQRARLFQPFTQVHEAERGGAGLGLHISRAIVEAHGGRVWAESEGPGRGSTFGLAVPLAPDPAGAPRPAPAGR